MTASAGRSSSRPGCASTRTCGVAGVPAGEHRHRPGYTADRGGVGALALPSTCSGLTLDASRSIDPFNEGFTNYAWVITRYNVATATWICSSSFLADSTPTRTLSPTVFPDKGDYRVELMVTAGSAAHAAGSAARVRQAR